MKVPHSPGNSLHLRYMYYVPHGKLKENLFLYNILPYFSKLLLKVLFEKSFTLEEKNVILNPKIDC